MLDAAMSVRPPASLRAAGWGASDVGKKRSSNEDAIFVGNELGLYIVGDGMGGQSSGEVASQEAVDVVHGMVKRGVPSLRPLVDPLDDADVRAACRLMESAVQAATYMVFSMAELDREKSGMGTTLSALLVLGQYAVTAQVGDSRIYRVRAGCVEQLTEDHTLIAWQLKQGLITADEARRSPHKHVITRAVGNREYVQVDTSLVKLEQGDRFLICSDGLYRYLRTEDVCPVLDLGQEQAASEFVRLANDRGGKDNITALVVEIRA